MKTWFVPRKSSEGSDVGWSVMTTLIGGFAVWGGVGWLLDRWLETSFLTPVGLIVGMALGIYAVVARFGPAAAPEKSVSEKARTATRDSPPPAGAREETECH